MIQTASGWEILGAIFNAIGLAAAWWMLAITRARYDAVMSTGGSATGPRALIGWRHFRCEGSRIAYHLIALVLGFWAMGLPDPTSDYGHAVVYTRVFLAALFTLCSVFDLLSDSRLANLLNAGQTPPRGSA